MAEMLVVAMVVLSAVAMVVRLVGVKAVCLAALSVGAWVDA